MTTLEFNEQFQELCDSFGVKPNDKRAAAWFKRLRHVTVETLTAAIERVSVEQERFPSLAKLASACANVSTESQSHSTPRAECLICDGYGFVQIGLYIYAGCCSHGAMYPRMQTAPLEKHKIEDLIEKQERDWDELYGVGAWKRDIKGIGRSEEKMR